MQTIIQKIGKSYTEAQRKNEEWEKNNPRVPLSFLADFYQQRLNFPLGGNEALAIKHHILENGAIDGDPIFVTEIYKDLVYIKESEEEALANELGYKLGDSDEIKAEKLKNRLYAFQNGVFILTPKRTSISIKPRGKRIDGKWELEIDINKDGDESLQCFKDLTSDQAASKIMGIMKDRLIFMESAARIFLDFLIGDKCTISTIGDPSHRIAKVWDNPLDTDQPKSVYMWDGKKIEGKTWGDIFRAIYGDDCHLTTDNEEIIEGILATFQGLYITTEKQEDKQ